MLVRAGLDTFHNDRVSTSCSSTSPNTCLARLVDLILEKKEQRVATYLMLVASMMYWLDKVQAMLARVASSM